MGLFDNFRKRNKERKARNIKRETLRRAAAGDKSDYVKKQLASYGTSLDAFNENPDSTIRGVMAGTVTNQPRTADEFISRSNRNNQIISNLQKELRGIVDQKSSLTSKPSTMGLTNAYQDAIRQFKDRGDLAQQAFRQELPNPLIKAAQGIGSFIRGGGLLGLLMRALDDQDKKVNVVGEYVNPQDKANLTDPTNPAGFRYNSETGRFERVPGAQVMDGETIQKAAEDRQLAMARQANAENMYNQMFGQPISMGGVRSLSVAPSMIPDGERLQKEAEARQLASGMMPGPGSMIPDGQTLQKQAEARQLAMARQAGAQDMYNQMYGTPPGVTMGPSFPNDAQLASGAEGINALNPMANYPVIPGGISRGNFPFRDGRLLGTDPNVTYGQELSLLDAIAQRNALGMNMGGDVMMERTMDPTYAKLKVFNDTAYE